MDKVINKYISYNSTENRISKTSDTYIKVKYIWNDLEWNGVIPLDYRYYGNSVDSSEEDQVKSWVELCYKNLAPDNIEEWKVEQEKFFGEKKTRTKEVFDVLNDDNRVSTWKCRTHVTGKVNDQSAARIKALKERGYVIITENRFCEVCNKSTYFDILIRIPRMSAGVVNRISISSQLRTRIYDVLEKKDSFFNAKREMKELVIDHKFPSARWQSGESDNFNDMSDLQIKEKFQLLTNQSNLLKERICQRCVKEGIRGDFLGINWFYVGNKKWEGQSKYDEKGCVGCPWYDLEKWKEELQKEVGFY
ncbi:hypothetical protein K8O68_07205 [Salipaludibacillus sp. CUR1]|uniref:hypothetical protein n=1 Tax=Salipaludibacillus sp. CUR1 TaxID=2820003 RepID=UPI001E287D47|nr:hypothetical protein [Salipaludibacillus sp. CUR1]MCE7792212.1 hypothetical protein [Salipaludibacillus sp. CUR1]